MLNSVNEQIATALGFPAMPELPQGFAAGPVGWSLEQAQATTGTFDGQVINFISAVGAGDTAGTPGRAGGVLDRFGTGQNPEAILRSRRCRIYVNASGGDDVLTGDFLSEIQRHLSVRHTPAQGQTRVYPVGLSLGTIFDNVAYSGATAGSPAEALAVEGRWVDLGGGLDVDLSGVDTFELYAENPITLPSGSTIRLTAWFDGVVAVRGQGNTVNRPGCGSKSVASQKAIANLARVNATIAYNAK